MKSKIINTYKHQMMNTQKLFRLLILLLLSSGVTLQAQTTDSLELVNLYNATNGANWTNNDNWLVEGQALATWYGIKAGGSTVTQVDLRNNNLRGSLPGLVLPAAQEINVSGNYLSGIVPNMGTTPAGAPNSLNVFDITDNQFSYADIAPNLQVNQPIGGNEGFRYQRQYYGRAQATLTKIGDPATLNPNFTQAIGSTTEFEWRRRSGIVKPASQDSTHLISAMTPNQLGRYYALVTDAPNSPGMQLVSYDVLLYNYGAGANGANIRPNELIINFNQLTQAQKDRLQELIDSGDIAVLDYCCDKKKGILLLDIINDDVDVLKEIIDATSKEESSQSDSRSGDVQDNNYDIRFGEKRPTDIWQLSFDDAPIIKGPNPAQLVRVAIIDTGYEPNPLLEGYKIKTNVPLQGCEFGANFVDNDADVTAKHPHGNHVASLALMDVDKTAPVGIMPIKAFGENGSGTLFDMICGIHYALDKKAAVINISAGYTGEKSSLLEAALDRARRQKTIVVAAAGNDGVSLDSMAFYPAVLNHPNMVVVGSIAPNDQVSDFSNYSQKHVDIMAYGECIKGAGLHGETEILSGTSQSTALVTREIALQLARTPDASFKEIMANIPTKDLPALSHYAKYATKIDITQELTGWAKNLVIGLLILLIILFIIWRIWKNNNP